MNRGAGIEPQHDVVLRPIIDRVLDDSWWEGSVWIGRVDVEQLRGSRIALAGGERFTSARILVWERGCPRAFVTLPVDGGTIAVSDLEAAVAAIAPVVPHARSDRPPISVVLCTKNRPVQLRVAVESLLSMSYPEFEIIVVDNDPGSGITGDVVAEHFSETVRLVDAHVAGLSVARNVGLLAARHDIVAFTDDDVVIDSRWLENLAAGFARGADVACVSGMVPSAELASPAQAYFDRRVGWARRCESAVYDIAAPPPGDRLFPLQVAKFGTGANFAVRRATVCGLGGFDEGMGVGSPAGGGEDIDMFVRILLAGHTLVYEPAAVVWHRHRTDFDGLEIQIRNYGLGLGAWITKLLVRPRTLLMVLRRVLPGLWHLNDVTEVRTSDIEVGQPELAGLHRLELRGVLGGPAALLRSRLAGRKGRPLRR